MLMLASELSINERSWERLLQYLTLTRRLLRTAHPRTSAAEHYIWRNGPR